MHKGQSQNGGNLGHSGNETSIQWGGLMEEFIGTIENLIVWFFLFGGILWGWLYWIIQRQKKKEESKAEFGVDEDDLLPDGDGDLPLNGDGLASDSQDEIIQPT